MSLTDSERAELLRQFYVEHMLPAAERLRQRQVRFFSLAPDRKDPPSTYYEARRDSTTASYVFELENLPAASWLRVRWQEYPELMAMLEPLVELSRAIEQSEEESGEVSPLIYAMF
ncbi:MAG: hypothetical protein ABR543_14005 [Gemmatimonadaceae bacterium]